MEQAKADRLRRDGTDADAEIGLLVAAAISRLDGVDGILGRALISQGWTDVMDGFPIGDRLDLVLAPVSDLISVTYFDADNVQTNLSLDDLSLHQDIAGSYLHLAPEISWPSTYDRDDAVRVAYTAGYGPSPHDVPAEIRLSALDMVFHLYNCPGEPLPPSVSNNLVRYTRPHF